VYKVQWRLRGKTLRIDDEYVRHGIAYIFIAVFGAKHHVAITLTRKK
jgi:hypothetical protein